MRNCPTRSCVETMKRWLLGEVGATTKQEVDRASSEMRDEIRQLSSATMDTRKRISASSAASEKARCIANQAISRLEKARDGR